ncbi:MAG: peptidoglycan-binding protein [Parcubacteria group bacterium]|nr:peptidoglycan-binding protein [Parcubacteria group bacterium]
MKKLLLTLFIISVFPFLVYAQSDDVSSSVIRLQTQIQELLKQIQGLQQQMTQIKTELGHSPERTAPVEDIERAVSEASLPELTRPLSRGSSGDDVRELQKFLSQDRDIYPERLITGYFGSLTHAAVKRWQAKHGIPPAGVIGPHTVVQLKERREQKTSPLPTPSTPAIPAEPVGQMSTTTVPAIPAILAQPATATSTGSLCVSDYSACYSKKECESAGFF